MNWMLSCSSLVRLDLIICSRSVTVQGFLTEREALELPITNTTFSLKLKACLRMARCALWKQEKRPINTQYSNCFMLYLSVRFRDYVSSVETVSVIVCDTITTYYINGVGTCQWMTPHSNVFSFLSLASILSADSINDRSRSNSI